MVEWLKKVFGSRTAMPCIGCLAHYETIEAQKENIQELKNQIQYLRDERRELQTLFNRSLRLEPEARRAGEMQQTSEPIGGSRNWNKVKAELEKKYRDKDKPSDPDKTQEYWKKKSEQMAHDAGLEPGESKDATGIKGLLDL